MILCLHSNDFGSSREVASMTIKEMQKKKKEYGYSNEYISTLSGVPLSTVQKVLGGVTTSPRLKTMRALTAVLGGIQDAGYYKPEGESTLMLSEGVWSYVPGTAATDDPKKKTIKDYLSLPEDKRAELIDGIIYNMAAPLPSHQIISGRIVYDLESHVRKKKGHCKVFSAPVDVQLDKDDKTVVQPDIFVICDKNKLNRTRVFGAPDLVIEILSKESRSRDMYLKNSKYKNAGVREYWIVDPDKELIIVYDYEHDDMVRLYSFDDRVPVSIWDGACEVNFKKIREELEAWKV